MRRCGAWGPGWMSWVSRGVRRFASAGRCGAGRWRYSWIQRGFHQGPVRNFAEAASSDTEAFARYFHGMLARGVYLAPSQFEAGFLSLAHTEADIDHVLEMGKEALAEAFA